MQDENLTQEILPEPVLQAEAEAEDEVTEHA
jgi:hypothetical protein